MPHTPGPWKWWTSNSWRRLTSHAGGRSGQDGGVLCPTVARDGHPDVIISEADMGLIEAAPDILAALKLACNYVHQAALDRKAWQHRGVIIDSNVSEIALLETINAAIKKAETPVHR